MSIKTRRRRLEPTVRRMAIKARWALGGLLDRRFARCPPGRLTTTSLRFIFLRHAPASH